MFCLSRTEMIRPVETGCCSIRSPHFAFARVRFRSFRFRPRPRFAILYNIHQTHRVFRGGKRAVNKLTIISPAVRIPVYFVFPPCFPKGRTTDLNFDHNFPCRARFRLQRKRWSGSCLPCQRLSGQGPACRAIGSVGLCLVL